MRAVLNLAHAEGVLALQPKVNLLPTDDSTPVIPPTEEELQQLLATCAKFREVAPLLPEVVEFVAETSCAAARSSIWSWWVGRPRPRCDPRRDAGEEPRASTASCGSRRHGKFREEPLSKKAARHPRAPSRP